MGFERVWVIKGYRMNKKLFWKEGELSEKESESYGGKGESWKWNNNVGRRESAEKMDRIFWAIAKCWWEKRAEISRLDMEVRGSWMVPDSTEVRVKEVWDAIKRMNSGMSTEMDVVKVDI